MRWSNMTRLLKTPIVARAGTASASSCIDMLGGESTACTCKTPPDFCANDGAPADSANSNPPVERIARVCHVIVILHDVVRLPGPFLMDFRRDPTPNPLPSDSLSWALVQGVDAQQFIKDAMKGHVGRQQGGVRTRCLFRDPGKSYRYHALR